MKNHLTKKTEEKQKRKIKKNENMKICFGFFISKHIIRNQ